MRIVARPLYGYADSAPLNLIEQANPSGEKCCCIFPEIALTQAAANWLPKQNCDFCKLRGIHIFMIARLKRLRLAAYSRMSRAAYKRP
jgi:hypothetical protein